MRSKLMSSLSLLVEEAGDDAKPPQEGADVGLSEAHSNKIIRDPRTIKIMMKLFEQFIGEPLGDWGRFASFIHHMDKLFQRFGALPLPKDKSDGGGAQAQADDPTEPKGEPEDKSIPDDTVEDETDTEEKSSNQDARKLGIILYKLGVENSTN